jgi:hypothetical protein
MRRRHPPPDVPILDESAVGVARSLRADGAASKQSGVRLVSHQDGSARISLENYDAIGRWRTEDGKFPIDATGTFSKRKIVFRTCRNESPVEGTAWEFTVVSRKNC